MNDSRVYKLRLLPPSPENPRNSEGSFVQLWDGSLFFAYSHFYGGGTTCWWWTTREARM
jgi:hypothetical protein